MNLYTFFICVAVICSQTNFAQNVGINPSGTTPNSSSLLDLNTGNNFANPNGKGLIIPNVSLISTTDVATIVSPANSLLVYNTNAAMTSGNGVGYYYYSTAAVKWIYIDAASNSPGTSGQVLTTQGSGVAPQWQNAPTAGGVGSDILYPDGINNITPVIVDYGTTAYTVTAGKNLYITSVLLPSGGGNLIVDGVTIAAPRCGVDGTAGATNATNLTRSYTLGTPIIVGAGKVVSYSILGVPAILCGFEVVASVTPVSAFINTSGTGTYTVPAGKTLYILSLYDVIASSISIDPATGTFLTVFNSHANSTTTAAGTFAQFNQLLQPIIVPANGLVKSSDALTTRVSFNGYLK